MKDIITKIQEARNPKYYLWNLLNNCIWIYGSDDKIIVGLYNSEIYFIFEVFWELFEGKLYFDDYCCLSYRYSIHQTLFRKYKIENRNSMVAKIFVEFSKIKFKIPEENLKKNLRKVFIVEFGEWNPKKNVRYKDIEFRAIIYKI